MKESFISLQVIPNYFHLTLVVAISKIKLPVAAWQLYEQNGVHVTVNFKS